jgi:FkbM family methyltransferase
MALKQNLSNSLVSKLHQFSVLRTIAKKFLHEYTLQQPFHSGVICLDAVEHSWAWTGNRRYETFDSDLQDKLLSLSQNYEILIDIGSNIGAMSLSILLRNPHIKAICLDPNSRAIALLRNSIRLNKLADRADVIQAAVSDVDGVINFDDSGSVTGHISQLGKQVNSVSFARVINENTSLKCLIKIDIEGFEINLLKSLTDIKNLNNVCFIIELHPLHFNLIGNPNDCLKMLLDSGAIVEDLRGQHLHQVENKNFTQVIAKWPHA